MTEIYNNKVVEVANRIKSDMNMVLDAIIAIRRHGSKFRAADLAFDLASVKSLAAKYGFGDLAAWKGNDEPAPPEPVVE